MNDIFTEAGCVLDKGVVARAKQLEVRGDSRGAKKVLLDAVKQEIRRLRAYSITGREAADVEALTTIQCKLARGMLCEDFLETFPQLMRTIADGTRIARAWEWISDKAGVKDKFFAKAVKYTLASAGILVDVVKNKNGLRDNLIKSCQSIKETTVAYCGQIYQKAKSWCQGAARNTVNTFRNAVSAVNAGIRKTTMAIGDAGRKTWVWLKREIGRSSMSMT